MRGITIGQVTDVHMELSPKDLSLHVPVTVELETERIQMEGGQSTPEQSEAILEALVKRGLRAQLQSASLITGQMLVSLDFFPNSPPAEIIKKGKYPELPSVPSDLQGIMRSVTALLDKVAKLPLDQVMANANDMLSGASKLVNGPELTQAVKSLNDELLSVRQLSRTLSTDAGPLLAASSRRQSGPTLEPLEGPHLSLELNLDGQAGNFIATFQCPVSSPMARQ